MGKLSLRFKLNNWYNRVKSSILTRQSDGTVTVEALGPTWSPILIREPDGTVTVTEA
jgi:hypothetical protein